MWSRNAARTARRLPRPRPGYAPAPPRWRLLAVVGLRSALGDLQRELRGRLAHLGIVDLADAVDQLDPLLGLEDRVDPARGLGALAVQRAPAHVDVVGVVAHRERVVRVVVGHQGDDLVRLHRALQGQQALDRDVGDRARALVAQDRDAVDGRDVDRGARGVLGDVARRGQVAVAAAQRGDRRLQARGGEVLEGREHAPVDLARADVRGAAAVDADAGVVDDALDQRLLAHQQDLADRGRLGVLADERVLLGGAVDRGRLEQLPAVEDRLRVDARRAAAGGPDLEQHVGGLARPALADAAEDRAADHAGALVHLLGDEVLLVEADRGHVGGGKRGGEAELLGAAGGLGVRALGVGEQALLGR